MKCNNVIKMDAKCWKRKCLIVGFIIAVVVVFLLRQDYKFSTKRRTILKPNVTLAVVGCGAKIEEALTLLKSVAVFTLTWTEVHFYTLNNTYAQLRVAQWPWQAKVRLNFTFHDAHYAARESTWFWVFRPCASKRMFLPRILPGVDNILYVDADTVFMRPVHELYAELAAFDSQQLAGVSEESDFYLENVKKNEFPYFGRRGLNSAVFLMNLTRFRKHNIQQSVMSLYFKNYKVIRLGDQDLFNIYFSKRPQMVRVIPCVWNYHPEFCAHGNGQMCHAGLSNGASLVHGADGRFFLRPNHFRNQPAFAAVYDAYKSLFTSDGNISAKEFQVQQLQHLLKLIKSNFKKQAGFSECEKMHKKHSIFTKEIARTLKSLRNHDYW